MVHAGTPSGALDKMLAIQAEYGFAHTRARVLLERRKTVILCGAHRTDEKSWECLKLAIQSGKVVTTGL